MYFATRYKLLVKWFPRFRKTCFNLKYIYKKTIFIYEPTITKILMC